MTPSALFFGPVGTSADTAPAASRLRLTRRGELLIYVTAFLVGFVSVPLGLWWT